MSFEIPHALDPHVRINANDPAQVREAAEALETTPDEVTAALEKVGDHPVAIALYLERPDAV